MGRRRRQIETPSGGSWMDTYGDLVTLLLTFFVLLYSFSSIDAGKWQALVESFSGSPPTVLSSSDAGGDQAIKIDAEISPDNGETTSPDETDSTETTETTMTAAVSEPVDPVVGQDDSQPSREPTPSPSPAPAQSTPAQTVENIEMTALYNDMQRYLQETGSSDQVSITKSDSQILIRLVASVIFEPGSDKLKPEAETVLTGASEIINRYSATIQSIRTEGHTDRVTPPEGDIESKWELAARRSAKVLQYVLSHSAIDPDTAFTVGYGSSRPVASDETEAGQDQNNRVDVVVTSA